MINRENAGIRKACIMGMFAATLCLLVLIFDISVAAKEEIMEFDNLQALLSADLTEGMVVKTKGLDTPGDLGAASYVIVSGKEENIKEEDMVITYKLQEGEDLYAKIILQEPVNVAQVGIMPENNVAGRLNILLGAMKKQKELHTLQFNEGTYLLEKTVALESMDYKGKGIGKTVLKAGKEFAEKNDKIFYCYPYFGKYFSIEFSGLTFSLEGYADSVLANKDVKVLSLAGINHCTVDNCSFEAYPADENGAYIKAELLYFQESVFRDIRINNCKFSNRMGTFDPEGLKDKNLVGGCLWFSGPLQTVDRHITDVSVADCEFENTTNNEMIKLVQGKYEHVDISGCNFKQYSHKNTSVITFGDGQFLDTTVKDCNITLQTESLQCVKMQHLTGRSGVAIDIENVTFNCLSGMRGNAQNSLVYVGQDTSSGVTEHAPATITVKKCTAKSENKTVYESFVRIGATQQKQVEVTDCDLIMPMANSVFALSKVKDCAIRLNGCKIDGTVDGTDSEGNPEKKSVLFAASDAMYSKIFVENNDIDSKLSGHLSKPIRLYYSFSDNRCSAENLGTMFVCNGFTQGSDYIIFRNENNTYPSSYKLDTIYPSSIKEQTLITALDSTGEQLDEREQAENEPDGSDLIRLSTDQILGAKSSDFAEDSKVIWQDFVMGSEDVCDGVIPVAQLDDPIYRAMNMPSESIMEGVDKEITDHGHVLGNMYAPDAANLQAGGMICKTAGKKLPQQCSIYISNIKLYAYNERQRCWLLLDNQINPTAIYTVSTDGKTPAKICDNVTYEGDWARVDLTAEELEGKALCFNAGNTRLDKADYSYLAGVYTFKVDRASSGKLTAVSFVDTKNETGEKTLDRLMISGGYTAKSYSKAVWGHTIPNAKFSSCNAQNLRAMYGFYGKQPLEEEIIEQENPAGDGDKSQTDVDETSGDVSINPEGKESGEEEPKTVESNEKESKEADAKEKESGAKKSEMSEDVSKINSDVAKNINEQPQDVAVVGSLKKTKISKLKVYKGKNKAKIKWKKVSGVSGYQIQYCKEKRFKKNPILIPICGEKKTSKVIYGQNKGKKYYVRIRTYVEKDGVLIVSKWSKKKIVKF